MQYINKSVCRGVAGRREKGWKPDGIVIHNDGGSMTPEAYVNWLAAKTSQQLQAGFAHYYGNRNQMARVEETYNGAWHVANYYGNMNFVGYEVCESLKVSDADFIANEEAVLKQAAKDLTEWGLPANRNTVKIHRRFVPTSCPHRSWDLHVGKGAPDTDANRGKMEDYFIARIKSYMDGSAKPVEPETPTDVKPDVEKLIGGIGMFIYWQPQAKGNISDAYGVWGNKRFYISNDSKLKHFRAMVENATGKPCKEYKTWARGSEQIRVVESFTEEQEGL